MNQYADQVEKIIKENENLRKRITELKEENISLEEKIINILESLGFVRDRRGD